MRGIYIRWYRGGIIKVMPGRDNTFPQTQKPAPSATSSAPPQRYQEAVWADESTLAQSQATSCFEALDFRISSHEVRRPMPGCSKNECSWLPEAASENTHQLKHASCLNRYLLMKRKTRSPALGFSLEAGRVTVEGDEKEASSSWQCAVQWPLSQFEALRRCSGRHSLAIHSSAASAWRLVLATDDVCPLSQGPLDGSRAFARMVGGRCQAPQTVRATRVSSWCVAPQGKWCFHLRCLLKRCTLNVRDGSIHTRPMLGDTRSELA